MEREVGKPEKTMVHFNQPVTEEDSAKRAENSPGEHHYKGELQVMNYDLPVSEAERFEDRDLFSLQIQEPG